MSCPSPKVPWCYCSSKKPANGSALLAEASGLERVSGQAHSLAHGPTNKVALCYDTRFCDVAIKDAQVRTVILENKDGRSAGACRTVVFASGDADVCARCGERTASLATNLLAGWFF